MTTYASLRKLMEDEATRANLWVTTTGKSVHARAYRFGGGLSDKAVCGVAPKHWRPLNQESATADLNAGEGWKTPTPCARCFDMRPPMVTLYYR